MGLYHTQEMCNWERPTPGLSTAHREEAVTTSRAHQFALQISNTLHIGVELCIPNFLVPGFTRVCLQPRSGPLTVPYHLLAQTISPSVRLKSLVLLLLQEGTSSFIASK